MESFCISRSDIHSWSHSDWLKSFENHNLGGSVVWFLIKTRHIQCHREKKNKTPTFFYGFFSKSQDQILVSLVVEIVCNRLKNKYTTISCLDCSSPRSVFYCSWHMKLFTNFTTKIRDGTWSHHCSHYRHKSLMLVSAKGNGMWFIKLSFLSWFSSYYCADESACLWCDYDHSLLFFGRDCSWWFFFLFFFPFVLFSFPLVNFRIGYVMDFMIIAPDHIMRVDQKGWFHREYTVINTTMIKSINIEKDGIWRSVFDYRTVCIRAWWEGEEDTMIHMRFVNNPEAIRVFISQKKYRGLL